jgi:predicted RND superfamily exporter protein
MDKPEIASQDPAGEVFDIQDRVNDLFESPFHAIGLIVEARDGDVLGQRELAELLENQERLISADKSGELGVGDLDEQSYLSGYFDTQSGRDVPGVSSIADAVDDLLRQHPLLNTSLTEASEEQVKFAIHTLFSDPRSQDLKDTISVLATTESREVFGQEIEWWTAPAFVMNVVADNDHLGGGALSISVGGDEVTLQKEEFNRELQRVLRGAESTYQLWGIAIDVNLESADEGQQAGAFITLTAIIAVAIVGFTLRSYWAVAFTGVGLATLIIWLKGISTLVGVKGGLINDLIVPIAMISLGVDFAVHAVRRYQEERRLGHPPQAALALGMAGVAGALTLAFLSDSIAFLSNVPSGIEAVIHFGLAASIAVASSFVVLGLVVPLAVSRADQMTSGVIATTRKYRSLKIVGGLFAATGSGSAIIVMIAVSVPIGLAILAIVFLTQIIVPLWIGARISRKNPHSNSAIENHPTDSKDGMTERVVDFVVRNRYPVLIATVIITALSVWTAAKLDASFDVKDFFAATSDFVVSLDKIDEHISERGGEPAIVLVEGNFADPTTIKAIQQVYANFDENPSLARSTQNEVQIFEPHILGAIQQNTSSDFARQRALDLYGVEVIDLDSDGLPDTSEGIRAILDLALAEGIFNEQGEQIFVPDRVATNYRRIDGVDATTLMVFLPGTRELSNVAAAFEQLTQDVEVLETAASVSSFGLTGSPFTRNEGLKATTSSLQSSIPIAAVAAFLVLMIAMRSVRFAIVTVIPVGLVVAWLYAIMYVFGFGLNFVTATIGAVSIGVGIDYSIHMTERMREELRRSKTVPEAAHRAAKGTGVALTASAASSIAGFAIMGFAPMPLFASYGILTAIMIALALAASVIVLPPLLTLVATTPSKSAPSDTRGN